MNRNEKGALGVDAAIGIVIFMAATALIFNMYLNIFKYTYDINVHEVALSYVVDIFEQIDYKRYEQVDSLAEIQNLINASGSQPDEFTVSAVSVQKYSDTNPGKQDVVERICIRVQYYDSDGNPKEFNMYKIKVKE